MKTFDFTQATISHNQKDPHSKALEPDCLSLLPAIMTQSQLGEGWGAFVLIRYISNFTIGTVSP